MTDNNMIINDGDDDEDDDDDSDIFTNTSIHIYICINFFSLFTSFRSQIRCSFLTF